MLPKLKNTLLSNRKSDSTAMQRKHHTTVLPNFRTASHGFSKTFLFVAATVAGVSSYAGDHEAAEEIRNLKDMTKAKPKLDTQTMGTSWTSSDDQGAKVGDEAHKLSNSLEIDLKDQATALDLQTPEE